MTTGVDLNKIDFEWVEKTNSKKELKQAYKALELDGGHFVELMKVLGEKIVTLDPTWHRKIYGEKKLSYEETKAINDDLNDFFESAKKIDNSLKSDQKENTSIFGNASSTPSSDVAKQLENQRLAENERQKGNECVKAKSYQEAVDCYTRSLELDPNQPFTYANRSMAYIKQKAFNNALADAEKAIEMDPKYLKAYHRRAKALAGLKKFEEAIKDYQLLLEKEPDNKDLNRELRDARYLLNKEQEANTVTTDAKSSDPVIEEILEDGAIISDETPKSSSAPADAGSAKIEEKPKKKGGFRSIAIEESDGSEEEEAPVRPATRLLTIKSKFPLTTKAAIDEHAKEAKALMKKGAEDFKKKFEEHQKQRELKLKEAAEPKSDLGKIDNASKSMKIEEVTSTPAKKDDSKKSDESKKKKADMAAEIAAKAAAAQKRMEDKKAEVDREAEKKRQELLEQKEKLEKAAEEAR